MSLVDMTTREMIYAVVEGLLMTLGVVSLVYRAKEGYDEARAKREQQASDQRPPEV